MRFIWTILALFIASRQDQMDLRQRAKDALGESTRILTDFTRTSSPADFSAAMAKMNTAAGLYAELHDLSSEGGVLAQVGRLQFLAGNYLSAVDADERALALATEAGDAKLELLALIQAGNHHQNPGDYKLADEYLTRARELAGRLGDTASAGRALSFRAMNYERIGDFSRAVPLLSQEVDLMRRAHDRRGEMGALHALGTAFAGEGKHDPSIAAFSQAAAIASELRDYNQQKRIFVGMGRANLSLGRYAEALEDFERPVPIEDPPHMQAIQLLLESHAFVQLGKLAEARAVARRAMDLIPQLTAAWLLTLYQQAAPVYRELGQPGEAIEWYRRALATPEISGDWIDQEQLLTGMAEAESDTGDLPAAREHLQAAIALTESVRAKVMGPELRAAFLAKFNLARRLYVELLMRAGDPSGAFEANEHGRARSMLDFLSADRIAPSVPVDPALLKRQREIAAELSAAYFTSRPVAGKVERLSAEYEEVESRIRAKSSDYAALVSPVTLSVPELQATLDDRTVIVEYSLGESRSFAWVVGKRSFAAVELPAKRLIEDTARNLYTSLTARNRRPNGETARARASRIAGSDTAFTMHAETLSRMVLAPLQAHIPAGSRIVLAPDGALQYMPFAALPSAKGALLIDGHELVELPSASVLPLLRTRSPLRSEKIDVLADPVFDSTDERVLGAKSPANVPPDLQRSAFASGIFEGGVIPRLPFTRREADRISQIGGPSNVRELLDFSAAKASLSMPTSERVAVLHLATHSIFQSEHPALSGIVLSLVDRNGKPQDGFLRMEDIFNLRVHARVVVLSACETALGKEILGEGVVGVARGFFQAGASTVISSLWRVDDAATAALMPAFYQGLLHEGLPASAALRAAQLELRKQERFRSPYYWAAFFPQGDWK